MPAQLLSVKLKQLYVPVFCLFQLLLVLQFRNEEN